MLHYGVSPAGAERPSSPQAMLLIISAHVALVAAVMSAKMELPRRADQGAPLIRIRVAPPPPPETARPLRSSKSTAVTRPVEAPVAAIRPAAPEAMPSASAIYPADDSAVSVVAPTTVPPSPPSLPVERHHQGPRLLTPLSELKPPYPESKLLAEEEATLTLRLEIDDRGRVIKVDSVGYADRAFLDAARRYIIAHWRYDPATEGDHAVPADIVVTLRFQLDG
ncbi:MAG TPA: energy transducer TonB [Sphingomicrobium sp.]|nr:energy transducer TonB [Sphingomicrobium sp.]